MKSARFFVGEPLKNWVGCTGRKFYGADQRDTPSIMYVSV